MSYKLCIVKLQPCSEHNTFHSVVLCLGETSLLFHYQVYRVLPGVFLLWFSFVVFLWFLFYFIVFVSFLEAFFFLLVHALEFC